MPTPILLFEYRHIEQQTLYPVPYMLDSQPPMVTLNTDLLRLADTWAQGSDVLRFNGTASDNVALAAVQIKIGDAPFVDATFDGSSWQTAQYVPDPEGQTLAVTLRAIDRSGQTSDFAGTIGVDLTPTDVIVTLPDTSITPTVVDPSINSVSVSFAGVDGTNEVSAFECRLNDGTFEACESPQEYTDLNNGVNCFEVRAIDTEGIVDPTPATEKWTISVAALQTTITESPSDPTESRAAAFVFSAAASYECALDDGLFSACTGPQSYAGLSDGPHTFLVRGVDGTTTGPATRFTWTVNNAAPVAASQTLSTNSNSAIVVMLSATDADPLTYDVGDPAHGVLSGMAPSLTYTPDTGFVGTDSFTFVADDGTAVSHIATVTVTVNEVTEVPFATCGDFAVFEIAPGVYAAPNFPGNLIVGTNGYDWINGTNGADLILGLDGPDDIFGRNGDDVICGGNGVDIINGQNGNDTLYGDNQPDWLIGGNGNDTLFGGDGWDDLEGNNGQDTL